MKKLVLLFIMISGLAFGQFQITESSNDWKIISKIDAAEISQNNNIFKIRFIDYKSKIAGLDTFSSFKSPYQRNVDKIERAIQKGNDGIKDGYYEFKFSGDTSTLNNIYNIIETHFKDKIKEELTLTFPEGNLYLKFDSSFGMYLVTIGIDGENGRVYTSPMLKKQSAKLLAQK